MPATAHVSYPSDGVGLVLIDNPPKNFGSWELAEKMLAAVRAVRDSGARILVLASDVPGYFIAHASLDDILAIRTGGTPSGDSASWRDLGRELLRGPMISIAANNGQAWGGGSELSWCANLRIAGSSATYGQPEVMLGIIPGGGGTTRLARLVGEARCMQMILTGRPVDSATALQWGLVHRVVPDERLRAEALKWARELAGLPPWSLKACRDSLLEGLNMSARDAAMNENRHSREMTLPETLQILRAAQARYAQGADSFEALGLPRESRPGR